jgi:hypothetical protein
VPRRRCGRCLGVDEVGTCSVGGIGASRTVMYINVIDEVLFTFVSL